MLVQCDSANIHEMHPRPFSFVFQVLYTSCGMTFRRYITWLPKKDAMKELATH